MRRTKKKMSLKSLVSLNPCLPKITCRSKTRTLPKKESLDQNLEPNLNKLISSRRGMVISVVSSLGVMSFDEKSGSGLELDFRLVAPDQTYEEAQKVIRVHARSLLEVKPLIDSELWKEARTLSRTRASVLKVDFYTVIQGSPKSQRPLLRKLYFDLFNNVSKLDFAARDKDAARVLQCYDNIVIALDDILSRI